MLKSNLLSAHTLLKISCISLLLCGLYSLSANAEQENNNSQAKQGEVSQSTQAQPKKNSENTPAEVTAKATEPTTANKNQKQGSAEVFIPSEQVSEDLAVSFPVDI